MKKILSSIVCAAIISVVLLLAGAETVAAEEDGSIILCGANGEYSVGYVIGENTPILLVLAEYDNEMLVSVKQAAVDGESLNVIKHETTADGHILKAFAFEYMSLRPVAASKSLTVEIIERTKRETPDDARGILTPNSSSGLHFESYTPPPDKTEGVAFKTVVPPDSFTAENPLFAAVTAGNKNAYSTERVRVNENGEDFDCFKLTVKDAGTSVKMVKNLWAEDVLNNPEVDGPYNKGHVCLLKVVYKITDVEDTEENETGQGKFRVRIDRKGVTWYGGVVQQDLYGGSEWVTAYIPFKALEASDKSDGGEGNRIQIDFAYRKQTVWLREFSIVNYETRLKLSDLPSSQVTLDAVAECTTQDLAWRSDALKRIEQIRKGDFAVTVVDELGNPIKSAEISANMTEHEFEWGTAVNQWALVSDQSGDAGKRYQSAISKYYNSMVIEGLMQWKSFASKEPMGYGTNETRGLNCEEYAHRMFDMFGKRGVSHNRGHSLIWDKESSLPDEITEIKKEVDSGALSLDEGRELLGKYVQKHFFDEELSFYGVVDEWDVMNESMYQHYLRDTFGDSIIKDWYDWARAYAPPNTKLFYNEIYIHNDLIKLLDKMEEMGVDYDGIGIQSHRTLGKAEDVYDELQRLEKYNKSVKITEFNIDEKDEILKGENMRDFMIACFSSEVVDGFYTWTPYGDKSTLLDSKYELSYAGKQYTDLVYNQWWTDEEGETDNLGTYGFRGFYGDYDITIKVNGKTQTEHVHFSKNNTGEQNNITVRVVQNQGQ